MYRDTAVTDKQVKETDILNPIIPKLALLIILTHYTVVVVVLKCTRLFTQTQSCNHDTLRGSKLEPGSAHRMAPNFHSLKLS